MYIYIVCLVLLLPFQTNGQGPIVPPGMRPLIGPSGKFILAYISFLFIF